MLLVVIALCRRVASHCAHTSRRAVSCVASRRFVSPHTSLRWSCHRPRVASSPPRLTCLVVAVSPVTSLSCQHRPLPHCCWLVVVFVSSPTRRRCLLHCVVSPHALRSCRLASPVASLRCIVLIRRAVAVSHVSCRVMSSPCHRAVAISCIASLGLPPMSLRWSCCRRRVASSPPQLTCPSLSTGFHPVWDKKVEKNSSLV